ncbi:uncharacterized protein PFL1_01228 [Pseudozyma flocculosa PF-1]|uniref:Uncharacterized protein n=1 Tax=Pseudozyma flocculosa TaxID=84751 RepID=A0A5C3EU66_9BASI|nr:uncharacterized protein PFL1_01228 [Pseudozyma flocculosa PF-1]EPQ31039.1 hypothetical protein PFL1_01228 [Pseudozyma flocculosa PF-1]SPO35883.1 uncharacterized protein PSFLO_01354 [Pseudozyma flocculosa]
MASELWTLAVVLLSPIVLRRGFAYVNRPANQQAKDASNVDQANDMSAMRRPSAWSSPFQLLLTLLTAAVVLTSVRNLVPVRYGFELLVSEHLIETLQRAFLALYASPTTVANTATAVEPLRIELRGGYASDIFLALRSPITIPTATLRSLLASTPSLLGLGFQGTEADLQSLVARLSSYDGRKLYLLVGATPLTQCVFCHSSTDYFYFALPGLVAQYAWRLLAIGFITSSPSDPLGLLVNRIGRLLSLRSSSATSLPAHQQRPQELDRKRWRGYATATLLGMLAIEALVLSELGEVRAGQGRWNHWHANLHLARQLLFIVLFAGVYFFPLHPKPSAFERTAATMRATHARLEKTLHNIEVARITREVVWRDPGMVRKVADWHAQQESEDTRPDCDAMVAFARKVGIDVKSMADACGEIANTAFQEAEGFNRELDQRDLAEQLERSDKQSQSIPPPASSSAEARQADAEPGPAIRATETSGDPPVNSPKADAEAAT